MSDSATISNTAVADNNNNSDVHYESTNYVAPVFWYREQSTGGCLYVV